MKFYRVISNRERYLPIKIILGYLLFTLVVFLFGPIEWFDLTFNDYFIASTFLLLSWGLLAFGYYYGSNQLASNRYKKPFVSFKRIIVFGAIINLCFLIPFTTIYTNKFPWDLSLYTVDQGKIYYEYQKFFAETKETMSGQRLLIAFSKGVFAPFIYAGIAFGVKYWKIIDWRFKLLFLLNIACQIIISIARGTDKEVVDLVVFILLPLLFFHTSMRFISFKNILIGMILFGVIFSVFTERRLGRYSDILPKCFTSIKLCTKEDHFLATNFAKETTFGISMMTVYMTQGYNGMALAMNRGLEFKPNFGLGHAVILRRNVESLLGISVYERTYNYRLREKGWNDKNNWFGVYTWYANDVSFFFVPIIFLFIGISFGKSWVETLRGSDTALMAVLFIFLLMIYSPVSNQLAVSFDMFFSSNFWFFYWAVQKIKWF